jgi:hypothetical protein
LLKYAPLLRLIGHPNIRFSPSKTFLRWLQASRSGWKKERAFGSTTGCPFSVCGKMAHENGLPEDRFDRLLLAQIGIICRAPNIIAKSLE